ncbi:hypothetical protein KIH86_03955 [Paenibacillus sp. HN-1]|uniref:hypothetical protein n=1 Tax=Paenibacillus TaxID=44249 RepID=UPI001CAA1072|nr:MULTISPECIES: hypothetical protein [Paenibacillus]MBY9079561.1 hypothetical protein [Paenibacillus sp. CGMCC 1.18879]MBY9083382.1 hypothetical protein [Paenibacillus sinensis]
MSFQQQQEEREVAALEEMYRQAVMLSYKLGEAISERIPLLPESTSPDPTAYPPCNFQHFEIKGIPVYQFSYEGMLPLYIRDKAYENQIREYYLRSTMEALRNFRPQTFNRALIYMCHLFSDLRIRDLDNRNRRHLINALRATRIIQDDNWKEVSFVESGFLDQAGKSRVELFVTERANTVDMIDFVESRFDSVE